MKTFSKYFSGAAMIMMILFSVIASAQNSQDVEMADTFRSDGKIYIVIAVMCIILTGLFIYLFMIGKKVSSMEKKITEKR